MITLHRVPLDMLLNVGLFLEFPSSSRRDNIDEITLAAILNDYEMLERYMKKHSPDYIMEKVTLSGSLKALKWIIKKGCPMNPNKHTFVCKGGVYL